jgi:NADH dehydrogenase FAD-containing subunit
LRILTLSLIVQGTVEYRSISEAMRASNPFVDFVQASATGIDTDSKMIKCKSVLDAKDFEVSYDYLVVGVGVQSVS